MSIVFFFLKSCSSLHLASVTEVNTTFHVLHAIVAVRSQPFISPWGFKSHKAEVEFSVRYLKELCQCQGSGRHPCAASWGHSSVLSMFMECLQAPRVGLNPGDTINQESNNNRRSEVLLNVYHVAGTRSIL